MYAPLWGQSTTLLTCSPGAGIGLAALVSVSPWGQSDAAVSVQHLALAALSAPSQSGQDTYQRNIISEEFKFLLLETPNLEILNVYSSHSYH